MESLYELLADTCLFVCNNKLYNKITSRFLIWMFFSTKVYNIRYTHNITIHFFTDGIVKLLFIYKNHQICITSSVFGRIVKR